MENRKVWDNLPEPLILYIFTHLEAKHLLVVRKVCRSWCRIASDEYLWKNLFHRDFKIDRSIPLAPGKTSWWKEYKRLKHHTPIYQTEVLTNHSHQVLHVSFSHNGKMFASCSKDGFIKVWNSGYPAEVRYSADMKRFGWNYTQYSQFNESDTMLLVTGVHSGVRTTSGEVAVFNLKGNFTLECRVLNQPYDIFGTWYADDYLLSGRLHSLGHLESCSALWLNKVGQAPYEKPNIKRVLKFFNKKASSISTILVANRPVPRDELNSLERFNLNLCPEIMHQSTVLMHCASSSRSRAESGCRTTELGLFPEDVKVDYDAEGREACSMDSPIRYRRVFGRGERASALSDSEEEAGLGDSWEEEWSGARRNKRGKVSTDNPSAKSAPQKIEGESVKTIQDIHEEIRIRKKFDLRDKLLIFTTASKTCTPHQVGFKRIMPFKIMESELCERISEQQERVHWQSAKNYFDKIDTVIDLHSHIIGMSLSPDHRFLYVNCRPWPEDYVIANPLNLPPVGQDIDLHVIDLVTLKKVGATLRSHKAYTSNEECLFIFLDVSDEYVSSGAEDKQGYLWDRHYGNCLAKFPHSDVVNSVAFNPKDPEMLITASDDYTLKIWRSRNRMAHLNLASPDPPGDADMREV